MATSYLSPGVYVEEVDRGSKPIEAVGTNTVGFLGESSKGPLNEAVLITNWSQFVKTFGDFKDCSEHLAHAVYGFFNNGGSRCFIVNVGAPETAKVEVKATEKKDEKAAAPVSTGPGRDGLYIGRDGGPGARTGLKCFEDVDEIAILAAPGQISPAGATVLAGAATSGAPTLTMKQREPPLLKNPYTACARATEQCSKSPNVRTNCDQFVISTGSFIGPRVDSPRNPTVLVPTASIGLEPRSTSST
jgi:hypothetical protein